jgi:hypothetical protein
MKLEVDLQKKKITKRSLERHVRLPRSQCDRIRHYALVKFTVHYPLIKAVGSYMYVNALELTI